MTTYTALSNTSLTTGKPITQSIARAWRDNPLAVREGDPSAPKIKRNALRIAFFDASGTFVVPSDVDQVWVEVAGAGGGFGTSGGTSSFGAFVSATGGAGSPEWNLTSVNTNVGPAHGTGSNGDLNIVGGGAPGMTAGLRVASGSNAFMRPNGGNGGLAHKVVTVTPGASVTVTVGTSGGTPSGANGWVIVKY